jgi:hypothetical protein
MHYYTKEHIFLTTVEIVKNFHSYTVFEHSKHISIHLSLKTTLEHLDVLNNLGISSLFSQRRKSKLNISGLLSYTQ